MDRRGHEDEFNEAWDFSCQLNPDQAEALKKLRRNVNWEGTLSGLELKDAIELLWSQFFQVAAPMAHRPEVMDDQNFLTFHRAVFESNGGMESLKSEFPYNQFELENEQQELLDLIQQMDETLRQT